MSPPNAKASAAVEVSAPDVKSLLVFIPEGDPVHTTQSTPGVKSLLAFAPEGDYIHTTPSTLHALASSAAPVVEIHHHPASSRAPSGFQTIFSKPPTHEWIARIEVERSELVQTGTDYTVLIFFGAIPADPRQWLTSQNLAGKCEIVNNKQKGDLIESDVDLNQAMLKHSESKSLEPSEVVPFLEKNFRSRVLNVILILFKELFWHSFFFVQGQT